MHPDRFGLVRLIGAASVAGRRPVAPPARRLAPDRTLRPRTAARQTSSDPMTPSPSMRIASSRHFVHRRAGLPKSANPFASRPEDAPGLVLLRRGEELVAFLVQAESTADMGEQGDAQVLLRRPIRRLMVEWSMPSRREAPASWPHLATSRNNLMSLHSTASAFLRSYGSTVSRHTHGNNRGRAMTPTSTRRGGAVRRRRDLPTGRSGARPRPRQDPPPICLHGVGGGRATVG